ncbi:MAG: SiaB family protein kinase [Bernardetiaceae bacterium]|jgi:hypothetical protein|nr:SiaB family protein kinase [Bernardetiaceae bacterium]
MEPKFSELQFYKALYANHIHLAFQGMISQDVLTLIGLSLRRRPDNEVVAKRLFGLVIELAQNIYHYSAVKQFSEKDQREVGVGIIAVGENEQEFWVFSGNMIENEKTEVVRQRCDLINSLDDEGLKKMYKDSRRQPQRDYTTGANVGLIDIVRRSGNPINYDIAPAEGPHSFLTFVVKISKTLPVIAD